MKDPSLEDKELATSLYDLLSKESLSLQLEAFKKGSITNVIGRVVEKEIEKAVKGQKSLKLIKSSSSLEITGVQRVRDDGSTVSHDSGSVNVDFVRSGFELALDGIGIDPCFAGIRRRQV